MRFRSARRARRSRAGARRAACSRSRALALGLLVAVGAARRAALARGGFPAHRRARRRRDRCCSTRRCRSSVVTLLCGCCRRCAARRRLGGAIAAAGSTQVSARQSLQWSFVGVQVALSVNAARGRRPAAAGASRSSRASIRVSSADHVLTFRISGSYGECRRQLAIGNVETMLDGSRALPGVEAAATSSPVPGVLTTAPGSSSAR